MFELHCRYRRIIISESFSANGKVDPNFKTFFPAGSEKVTSPDPNARRSDGNISVFFSLAQAYRSTIQTDLRKSQITAANKS
jgi:hypothetical protein